MPEELIVPDDEAQEQMAQAAEIDRQVKLVRNLRNEFNWYKRERESVMDPIWDECYRLYRAQSPDPRRSGDWRSRVHVPYAFTQVEDVVPHLMAGVFDAERPFKIASHTTPELAEAHDRLARYQTDNLMDFELNWEEIQKTKAIFGTAPFFVGFRILFEDRQVWKMQTSEFDPTLTAPVIEKERFASYVGNYLEPIHVYNVYPHPKSTINRIPKLYWVQFRTKKELEDIGLFKNLEKLTPNLRHQTSTRESYGGSDQAEFFGEMRSSFPNSYDEGTTPEFRVVMCFDNLAKKMYAYAGPEGSEVLLFEGDNPFFHGKCPILFDRYTPVPKEFYGMGTIEPGISLMHEGNLIRNQRRDNVTLAINLGYEIRENDIDDEEEELVSKPGFIVHSHSGDAIRPIPVPDVTSDAFREEKVVEADLRGVSGLGGPIAGQTDPNSPSGTKFSLQQKAQLMRLSRAIKRQALAIKSMVEIMVRNAEQFYPIPMVRQILGPIMFSDWSKTPPVLAPLNMQVSVLPVGVFANDDVLRQQFTNMMNIFTNNPLMIPLINQKEVLRAGLKLFPNFPETDRFFKQDMNIAVADHKRAVGENQVMSQGQVIPQADLSDDEEVHLQHHNQLLVERPDLAQIVTEHMQSHINARHAREAQMIQAQMGMGGGDGQGGGLLNPNRQASSTSEEGIIRSSARGQGRTGS